MSEPNAIKVFQDLILRAPAGDLSVIRSAVVDMSPGRGNTRRKPRKR